MHTRAEDASRLLKTLGNAQRLRMLCLLVRGEMSVGQINERLPDLSQSALSQHLAKLREEGLVRTRREAQTIWYELPEGPVQSIIATLYSTYCATDESAHRRTTKPPKKPTVAPGRRRAPK
ncbi:MAG: metalloregulator ArsR/SmtB family transcription factor [Dokdonella sp.]